MAKPIALAADHGGFELKEAVKAHLKELGLEYIDFGTHSTDSKVYYTKGWQSSAVPFAL